jgi:hypothetical protein
LSSSSDSTRGNNIVRTVLLCVPGGVVFDALQFVLIVVVRQSVADFKEGKGGIERPTNMLSKTGGDAARSTVFLFTDDPVERLHRVGTTVALARAATVEGPPCLGAGAVARGAGTGDRTEAAEVLAGRCRLLTFTIPAPHGGVGGALVADE